MNKPCSSGQLLRLRGRTFIDDDIQVVKTIVKEHWTKGRSQISRLVCKSLEWYQDNGRLKERACRDALRTLEERGVLSLPPTKSRSTHSATHTDHSFANDHPLSPTNTVSIEVNDITSLSIVMVRWSEDEELWNRLIATYHYLGYTLIVGRHLKYIVYEKDIPIACLGWGDAAWHLKDRDTWIGWSKEDRQRNIKLAVNNVRFLILPWVRIPNFASFILSRGVKAMTRDWEYFYGVKPALLETFVDNRRFKGTCYRAANWIYVGSTKGYARRGYSYHNHQLPKDIYIYPLCSNVRKLLKS